MVSKDSQEDEVQLAGKEAQGPPEVQVSPDSQDSQALREPQDPKDRKVKHRHPRGKWGPQGSLGCGGRLGERVWKEFLELQE